MTDCGSGVEYDRCRYRRVTTVSRVRIGLSERCYVVDGRLDTAQSQMEHELGSAAGNAAMLVYFRGGSIAECLPLVVVAVIAERSEIMSGSAQCVLLSFPLLAGRWRRLLSAGECSLWPV